MEVSTEALGEIGTSERQLTYRHSVTDPPTSIIYILQKSPGLLILFTV